MTQDPSLAIAVPLIAEFEGFRAEPYLDVAGTPTIGFGFTYLENGSRVTMQTPSITQAAAEARLSNMVIRVVAAVRAMVNVPITDNQCAAMTSFAWNEGTGALRSSNLMLRLNEGNPAGAAECFGAWVYAGGKIQPGLVARRAKERALFLMPDIQDKADALMDAELTKLNPTPEPSP